MFTCYVLILPSGSSCFLAFLSIFGLTAMSAFDGKGLKIPHRCDQEPCPKWTENT